MINKQNRGTLFACGLVAISIATIIAALMIVGGPQQARDEVADRKIFDQITEIERQLTCFVRAQQALPRDLAALDLWAAQRTDRLDCYTQGSTASDQALQAIRYERIDDKQAKLCAAFKRKSSLLHARTNRTDVYISEEYAPSRSVMGLDKPREAAGEHCYEGTFP